jgi:hypothetical protein
MIGARNSCFLMDFVNDSDGTLTTDPIGKD